MSAQAFEQILPLKTEGIANEIIDKKKMSLPDALHYLYDSQLYALLEQEDTKMWYYSPQMLFHWLETEKTTGKLLLPD